MPTWLDVQRRKAVLLLTLNVSINDMKHFESVCIHLSCATAIFFLDCCQFGPNWIFGLKMEVMVCAGLVGGTTEQSCLFPGLIC